MILWPHTFTKINKKRYLDVCLLYKDIVKYLLRLLRAMEKLSLAPIIPHPLLILNVPLSRYCNHPSDTNRVSCNEQ